MSGPDAAASPWTSERGGLILQVARASLVEAFGLGGAASRCDQLWLSEPGATFVTLRRQGELRGCVGTIRAHRPLFEDVWSNARAAAFHDTRFHPVEPWELPEIAVEVSLLSAPEPLACACEDEAFARMRPGVDGIIFEYGECRSTFLPQVWEQLPAPRDFLDQLRRKAGLRPGFWAPDVRLQRYTVMKWQEAP